MDIHQVLADLEELPPPKRSGFGLHDDGMTLDEIAQIEGVAREPIRQIEIAALRKFAKWANAHGYRLRDLIDSQASNIIDQLAR